MKYTLDVLIPPDRENFVAEILIDGEFVARVSQEKGPQHLVLEFPRGSQSTDTYIDCDLDTFQAAIEAARQRFRKLATGG
jgi:hypothetical protein